MKVEIETKLDYSDVLIVPQRGTISSRSEVDLTLEFFDLEVIPIIAANMDGVGTFEMAQTLSEYRVLTALTKHYALEELIDFYSESEFAIAKEFSIYSMGTSTDDVNKFEQLTQALESIEAELPKFVCIDVANGYTKRFEDFVASFAERNPQFVLIVGNVATPEQTERLIECGADVVKIGIGPGSVCTTRKQTGIGYPQFSAVLECAEAARDAGGQTIADGGCTCPGDVAKAFGAGADLVMLGGMLAGTDEGGSTQQLEHTRKFYGMASKKAQDLHNGGIAEYRSSEGKEVVVPYRGPVKNVISDLLGGLRSTCAYVGADNIRQLQRKAKFVRVNKQLNEVFSK